MSVEATAKIIAECHFFNKNTTFLSLYESQGGNDYDYEYYNGYDEDEEEGFLMFGGDMPHSSSPTIIRDDVWKDHMNESIFHSTKMTALREWYDNNDFSSIAQAVSAAPTHMRQVVEAALREA